MGAATWRQQFLNSKNQVWIERINNKIARIFRSTHSDDWKAAMAAGTLETCPKKDAIGEIRHQVYERCGGRCEWCGRPIPENGPLTVRMHQHEIIPKGNGGEVSLKNCLGLCYNCHINNAHGDRRPQWSGKTFEEVMGDEL